MDFLANSSKQKHFVLVHGAGHGAWCWYKLKPLLESTGQRVTAIDLSASGINTKSLDEIHTLHDYAEPLMEFMAAVPPDQKVILVGHSFGGYCLALAMEHFPEKISIAVFVAAFMPDTIHDASYVGNQVTLSTLTLFFLSLFVNKRMRDFGLQPFLMRIVGEWRQLKTEKS